MASDTKLFKQIAKPQQKVTQLSDITKIKKNLNRVKRHKNLAAPTLKMFLNCKSQSTHSQSSARTSSQLPMTLVTSLTISGLILPSSAPFLTKPAQRLSTWQRLGLL